MEEIKLCCYGCGREAKFKFKNGKECCSENMNGCPEIRRIRKDSSLKLWDDVKNKGKIQLKEIGTKRNRSLKPEFCEYGCGLNAEHQLKNGKWCCSDSSNKCPNNRRKNSERIKSLYDCGKLKQDYQNISQESKDRMRWSKGLTKETDDRVRKAGEKISQNMKNGTTKPPCLGKRMSDKEKGKMSESRIKYLKENPHVKWYKVTNGEELITVQGKWEKKVAEWLTDMGIKWHRKGLKFKRTRTYTPDFYIDDVGEFLEVKGWWKENDKYKMFLAIKDNPEIRIRILDKRHINKLDGLKIMDLPFFVDEFKIEDIDFSKFENHWDRYCSGGEIGETPRT